MLSIPKRLSGGKGTAQRRSAKQELEVAKRVGGKRVPGSGCSYQKADCRKKGVALIECKTTTKTSFSINMEMLNKIETAAAAQGELPVLVIEFLKDGKPWRSVCVTTPEVLDKIKNL